jgi:hypothetical protein
MADSSAPLFGAAAAVKDGKKPKEKRTMLKNIDTVAAKTLDPYGVSIMDEVPAAALWKIVCKGDDWAMFFSEFAADDTNCKDPLVRVGIGLSRLCEILVNAFAELKTHVGLRKMLKEEVVKKLDAEMDLLLPHLQKLNAGKKSSSAEKKDSFKAFKDAKKRKLSEASAPTELTGAQLDESAGVLFEWLQKGTKSNLRMAMSYLSVGGVFFSAHAADKTARAWLTEKQPAVTKEIMVATLKARHGEEAPAASSNAKFEREEATGDLFTD